MPIELKEGYFWFDRRIIRAFDKNGVLRSLCKVNITKDLIVTYRVYKDTTTLMEKFDFESWEETYNRHKNEIGLKLEESIQVVKNMVAKYPEHKVILTTSKGKDSNLTDYVLEKAIGYDYTKILEERFLEHNDRYLLENFYNLQEKYYAGQKDFGKETYENLCEFIKTQGMEIMV